jgi:hypothetical protein
MGATQSRYFIKYKVIGKPGHFWTEYRVWDIEHKSLKIVMEGCIFHCKEDASKILKEKFKDDDIDILTFNLVEAITKIEI